MLCLCGCVLCSSAYILCLSAYRPHLGGLLIRPSAVDALEKSDDEKDAVKAAAPTGTTVKIDGEELLVMREEDIMAVVA